MAIRPAEVVVDNTRDVLVPGEGDSQTYHLVNTGSVVVYVGDATVTPANGYPIYPGGEDAEQLAGGEELYGVTAAGSSAVRVLRFGAA
jgi:hypothetical protein